MAGFGASAALGVGLLGGASSALGAATSASATTPRTGGSGGISIGGCTPGPDGRLPWQTPMVTNPGEEAEQETNVSLILGVIVARSLPRVAAKIALMTVLAESRLINLEGGDRDSVGLFQQRPSMGWGTVAELRDPPTATARFLDGAGGNPGLLDYDYESMEPHVAAQTVQRSFDSTGANYAVWSATADAILACHTSGIIVSGEWASPMPAGSYLTSPFGPRFTPVVDFHAGIDLDYGVGDGIPLYALTNGLIIDKFSSAGGGNVTTFEWANGMFSTYLHQAVPSPLSIGTEVTPGMLVGSMGNTGASTGSHLHLEIGPGVFMGRSGLAVLNAQDPLPYLAAQGITFPTMADLYS